MRWFARFNTIIIAAILGACGKSSNFNVIWGGEDGAGDGKLLRAKMFYDRGEYDKAETLASELLAVNPDHEAAAIVLAYSNLSQGGIDPFTLSCKLVTISTGKQCRNHPSSSSGTSSNTNTTSSTNLQLVDELADTSKIDQESFALLLQDQNKITNNSLNNSESKTATETLKKLSAELLSLTSSDYDALSTEQYSQGLFANAPILKPERVTDSLRDSINTLRKMNAALKAVCRFVDDKTKTEFQNTSKTGRYDTNCEPTTNARANTGKAHFLWGFAHLAEAMVYQSVILYSSAATTTGASSNFEAAVATVNNRTYTDAAGLSAFANDVSELNQLIAAVFDTTDGSMLGETLKSLRTVGLSFTALGLPESFSAPITQAIDSLDQIAQKITQTTDPSTKNAQALKAQMTESFAKTVGSKVGTVYNKQLNDALAQSSLSEQEKADFKQKFKNSTISQISEAEKKAVFGDNAAKVETSLADSCKAYDQISKDLPQDTKTKNQPEVCS